jgi:hypothetical protein
MKKLLIIVALFALVFAFTSTTFAHFPEGVVYLAYNFAKAAPVIDGQDNDWAVVGAAYTFNTEDLYETLHDPPMGKNGSGVDLADLTVQGKMGWRAANNSLYFFTKTYDNIHMITRPSGDISLMWRQDGIEIMVDADHSGGQYNGWAAPLDADQIKRLTGAQAQQNLFAYPNADGINQSAMVSATWYGAPGAPDYETGFSFTGTMMAEGTTTYEVRIGPAYDDLNWAGRDQSVAHTFKQDEITGFGWAWPDFDDPNNVGTYHAYWNITGTSATYMSAERLADVLLAPPETAVTPSTWGRIKASFN